MPLVSSLRGSQWDQPATAHGHRYTFGPDLHNTHYLTLQLHPQPANSIRNPAVGPLPPVLAPQAVSNKSPAHSATRHGSTTSRDRSGVVQTDPRGHNPLQD